MPREVIHQTCQMQARLTGIIESLVGGHGLSLATHLATGNSVVYIVQEFRYVLGIHVAFHSFRILDSIKYKLEFAFDPFQGTIRTLL